MKIKVFLTVTLLMVSAVLNSAETQPDIHPNIVVILADDLGYGSLNCYGAEEALVRTPNIDGLAENGMLFTNAYTASSVCTPTRYSLLMGRYPWRSSLKYGVKGVTSPLLPDPDKVTIADWLKERGYTTAAIGKWHLGYGTTGTLEEFTGILKPGPLELGFDYHFGVPQNHGDKMGVYIENDRVYGIRSDKIEAYSRTYYGPQYYGFDAPQRVNTNTMETLTEKSVEWLSQQRSGAPFFLYFAPVAVHHPITPSNFMRGKSDCGPYGDFIQDLDWSVGKILETLEYMGVLKDSIVIFTSDNGGEIPSNKPTAPEIQAVNFGLKINGDLKGDKHTIWEGGTRVPLIVSWPGRVNDGTVSEDLVGVMDIFATLADILDGDLPENKEVAPDSISFWPALAQQDSYTPRKSLVTADMYGMQAVRVGDWKLVDDELPAELPDSTKSRITQPLEKQLYNLKDDAGETKNLFEQNPQVAERLMEELSSIRIRQATR